MKALYVHVPFCDHICAYCDFMRCGYYEPLAEKWLLAVKREIQEKKIEECKTVYIGGGTPSALSTSLLEQLLELLQPYLKKSDEASIEVNADSFSDEKLALCKRYGINRISMGAQTFQTDLLKIIDRKADYATVKDAIMRIHEHGIHDISLDLMYGLPSQTMKMWLDDLSKAASLPITHLSLYALTIEEHSRFGRVGIQPCDPDKEADFYEKAIAYLQKQGFEHYEISNFAKNGCYAKHNLMYWHYEDFYGIGCGASGKSDHMRYDNTRNLHTYLTKGACPNRYLLNRKDEMFETVMMGLRLRKGIHKQTFYQCFKSDIHDIYRDAIQKHIQLGNLQETANELRTTYQGMLILHDILIDFL